MRASRSLFYSTALLGLLLLNASASFAKDPAPLTAENVRSLLATLPEIEALGEQYAAAEDPLPRIDGHDGDTPAVAMERMRNGMLSGALVELKAHAAWPQFQAITAEQGFASVEEWANVGDRVMAGFIQLQLATEAPEAQAQMEQARAEIAGNPDLPEEQKKALLEQLDAQMGMFEALRSSKLLRAGDIEVIEPMLDEIRAAFERG